MSVQPGGSTLHIVMFLRSSRSTNSYSGMVQGSLGRHASTDLLRGGVH